jgi:hypothetical protein
VVFDAEDGQTCCWAATAGDQRRRSARVTGLVQPELFTCQQGIPVTVIPFVASDLVLLADR